MVSVFEIIVNLLNNFRFFFYHLHLNWMGSCLHLFLSFIFIFIEIRSRNLIMRWWSLIHFSVQLRSNKVVYISFFAWVFVHKFRFWQESRFRRYVSYRWVQLGHRFHLRLEVLRLVGVRVSWALYLLVFYIIRENLLGFPVRWRLYQEFGWFGFVSFLQLVLSLPPVFFD